MKRLPLTVASAARACALGVASCLVASCGGVVGSEGQPDGDDAADPEPAPSVVTLARGQDPSSLAVDGARVYWTDSDGAGSVKSVPIVGGEVTTLASGQMEPSGIAVDSERVYWIANRAVVSAPLAGGALVTLAAGQVAPWQLAVDATHVYWTDVAAGNVLSVPLGGGTTTTLAAGQAWPTGIAVDDSGVYWTNGGTAPDYSDGAVMFAPLAGGTSVTLASGVAAYSLALFGGRVYFTNAGDGLTSGLVASVSEAGGAQTTLASGQLSTWAIAVDGASAYWTTDDPVASRNRLMTLAGGTAVSLWSSARELGSVVTDGASLYWSVGVGTDANGVSDHDGRIMRMSRR